MRIGIYGGSFNPIHFGHLITVSEALEIANLDLVYFVVANRPPHKRDRRLADGVHRLKMTELAIESNDLFYLSDIEFQPGQPPYTVELLASFRRIFPNDELCLIIGCDSLFELKSWYRWELLFQRADRILAMARHGFPKNEIDDDHLENAEILDTPIIEISSTEIRNRIREGKSIKYLMPQVVEDYIRQNRLYY